MYVLLGEIIYHMCTLLNSINGAYKENNNSDVHLPAHTHNARYLLHATRNVNVPSVYYNLSVMMNMYESFSYTEPRPFRWAMVKCF